MESRSKQPSERLDFDVDMTEWFTTYVGDDIQSVAVTVTRMSGAPDLLNDLAHESTVLLDQPASQRFKLWLSRGVSGVTYKVTSIVETEGGRIKEVEFLVRVKDR